MANNTGRWIALLAISFLIHAALIVNSASTARWNEQGRIGNLLAQQLADAAAPLAQARDMVSLSVLTNHYEDHPGIAGVRLYDANPEVIAETAKASDGGRLFLANIQLQQQILGQAEVRFYAPLRGDIVRENQDNILFSAALHFAIFIAVLLRRRETLRNPETIRNREPLRSRGAESRRETELATQRSPASETPRAPVATSAHDAPLHFSDSLVPDSSPSDPYITDSHVAAPRITPPFAASPNTAPARVTLLHIALDDPNNLLTRVNAAMADEMLSLFDQFVDRVTLLYGGSADTPFSPAGVLLRFTQDDAVEREFHAIAAAQLFLQLVEDATEERRQHSLLCLACKAGVLHENDDASIAALLAYTAPGKRILSSQPKTSLDFCCRLSSSYHIAIAPEKSLRVALVEAFMPEYQQLINNQSQKILGIKEE